MHTQVYVCVCVYRDQRTTSEVVPQVPFIVFWDRVSYWTEADWLGQTGWPWKAYESSYFLIVGITSGYYHPGCLNFTNKCWELSSDFHACKGISFPIEPYPILCLLKAPIFRITHSLKHWELETDHANSGSRVIQTKGFLHWQSARAQGNSLKHMPGKYNGEIDLPIFLWTIFFRSLSQMIKWEPTSQATPSSEATACLPFRCSSLHHTAFLQDLGKWEVLLHTSGR